ncbi:hypothetical protein Tco_1575728 [Tanacetum coccineum]
MNERNRHVVEAARTIVDFSLVHRYSMAEAIATASTLKIVPIIHRRIGKTPYGLLNGRKLDILLSTSILGSLIIPRMNVKLLDACATAMAFEQPHFKPASRHDSDKQFILDHYIYAPSTITTRAQQKQPTVHELDLLFEAMYDDYIGGQPSAALRTVLAAQVPLVL